MEPTAARRRSKSFHPDLFKYRCDPISYPSIQTAHFMPSRK